jgi:hypothetical protein
MNRSKFVQVVMLGIFLLGSALALPAMAQNGVLHDTEPGSVLVFPRYNQLCLPGD